MNKTITLLAIGALLTVVLISGCTQQPSGGTGDTVNKEAEDKAAATLESELEQAIASISTEDIENALLNQ